MLFEMNISISSIYFSPVKSISFQKINKCEIKKNIGIINDRLFAFSRMIDSGKAQKMEQEPKVRKLINFLTLKNTPILNKYLFEYNEGNLELFDDQKKLISINPDNPEEAHLIEKEVLNLEQQVKGPVFLLKNDKNPFFDTNSGGEVMNSISLINHNSIKDFEKNIGKEVEYQRFRGNFYVNGLDAWNERNWIGKTININGIQFKVDDHIQRCSATNLKPKSGEITFNLPQKLKEFYDHMDFGVYLIPLEDGQVSIEDEIII